jgi:hypothetical protein
MEAVDHDHGQQRQTKSAEDGHVDERDQPDEITGRPIEVVVVKPLLPQDDRRDLEQA